MRFYYISIFSVVFLGLIYLIGTGLLAWIGLWLRKRWKRAWTVMVPLFLLLYIAPIGEEFWIAWNFGRLCKKDAGLFVYKTVEVEGFYDDTIHWWRQLAESKYQFMESRDNTYGGLYRVERDGSGVRHFKIERPTARYHYRWPHMDTPMRHKVEKIERIVVDSQTGETLARETKYRRKAPWFFIGLDRPVMLCPGPGEHPLEKYGSVFNLALKPARN